MMIKKCPLSRLISRLRFNADSNKNSAFTIVELLVVIVVIGILATITIVSYTGITQRADASVLQSDLDNTSRLLKLYQSEHGVYPSSLNGSNCPLDASSTPDNNYCLKPASGITYKYSVDNTLSPKTFSLYATKNNNKYFATNNSAPAPTTQVSATGGTVTSVNGYNIHTFTTSGTFTVTGGDNVEVLVVGGGGGGGYDVGGGGGAGGLIYKPSYSVTAQAYTVTIGSGGAGGISPGGGSAPSGGNSIFGSLTAIGGGGAGNWSGGSGAVGGSGGGATSNVIGGGGTATAGQGNSGGAAAGNMGSSNDYSGASGGGGAGQAGGNGISSGWGLNSSTYGYGGNGLQYSISGTPTYYAGGGGAGSDTGNNSGIGGLGGGGTGNSGNAVANTGGGGGGAGLSAGGSGASGIVIIRYPN